MCVIFVCEDGVRPSEEMIEKGWEKNPSGAGAAWRDTDDEGNTIVRWKKGLSLEEVKELAPTLPFPFVLHFRVPSNGTSLRKAVNHPFPMEPDVSLALEGYTTAGVLFHNGFWGNWKDKLVNAAMVSGIRLPADSWSDSRGLAWMACHFGLGFLELVDEKTVAFGPDFLEMAGSVGSTNGWSEHNGIWCSNMLWNTGTTTSAITVRDHRTQWQRPTQGGQQQQTAGSDAPKEGDTTTRGRATNTGADERTGGSARPAGFRRTGQDGGGVDGAAQREPDQQEVLQAGFARCEGGGATVEVEVVESTDPALTRRFLCGISPRALEIVGNTIDEDPAEAMKCCKCNSTKKGVIADGKKQCYQCYFAKDGDALATGGGPTPRALLCETCKTRYGVALRDDDLRWICSECWVKAGRPTLTQGNIQKAWTKMADNAPKTIDQVREKRREDAARGISFQGSM